MSAAYHAERDGAYAERLDNDIENFADWYSANTAVNKQLLFLFPAGTGSALRRSILDFKSPVQFYYLAWAGPALLAGDAVNLQIGPLGVDHNEQLVVPDGEVEFDVSCFQWSPYLDFSPWCITNEIYPFVFGWDWRRGVKHTADFFLDVFMPKFERCFPVGADHPLKNFSLVGHSAGGMVVKAIANRHTNNYVQGMKAAITVASPFYGYGEQARRFIRGDSQLNFTVAGRGKTMAGICSTMLGGYEYLYMDEAAYDANAADFSAATEEFKLASYPSMDKNNPAEVADAFNPVDAGGLVRYPAYGLDNALLAAALAGSQEVSADLDPAVSAKFFCIRGVQFQNGQVLDNTPVAIKWARVAPGYDPNNPLDVDPIEDVMGPGDGVQQAWGSRLLRLPQANVITVKDDLEHATLMNRHSVQSEIGKLLGLNAMTMTFLPLTDLPLASQLQVKEFLTGLHENVIVKWKTEEQRRAALVQYLRRYKKGELSAIFIRAYTNLLKSPHQLVDRPDKPAKDPGQPRSRP